MKIFYGEKLVSKKEHLVNNRNLIHRGKKLLVLSETDCTEILLANKNKLVLWGKIYAVIKDNGKSIPVITNADGDSIIKKIFNTSNINDFISKVDGDFIGCLIKTNDEVIIFCDRYNKKDVFYSERENGVIAAIDISPLIPVGEGKQSYDQAALANLLTIYGGYPPKRHTIYKNVHRLGVGERLVLHHDTYQIEKLPFLPLKVGNYGLHELKKYAELLNDAVKIRGSDRCNWVYLSSGWDSSTILALLVKNFGSSHVKAVTGKMEYSERAKDANIFEIKKAQKIAEYFSVEAEIVPFDYYKKDAVKYWEEIKPFLKDNHIYYDCACNYHLLSKYISKKGSPEDALFCGEISDGAHNLGFSQFTTIREHPVLDFREYSDKMSSYLYGPTFLKSIIDGTYSKDAVYNLLRSRLTGCTFEDDEQKLNEHDRKTKLITSFFLRSCRIPFYSLKNELSLTDDGIKMYESEFNAYLKECIDVLTPDTLYSWMIYLYNSFHWQGSTVKTIPETARFHNLHLSMPFWDMRLQRFFSEMPENWGRGLELRPTKYPLKWMLENKIDYPHNLQIGPHSYLYDVNPDFSLEEELVYYSGLTTHFQKTLKDYPFEKILNEKYFKLDYYRKLTDGYINGERVSGKTLWDLYNIIWLCWIGWY